MARAGGYTPARWLAVDRGLDRGDGFGFDLDQIELSGARVPRAYDVSMSETATNANSAKAAAMTKSYRSSLIFRVMMPTPFFVRIGIYKARPRPYRCDCCHEFVDTRDIIRVSRVSGRQP
jgi:hypothetical protein